MNKRRDVAGYVTPGGSGGSTSQEPQELEPGWMKISNKKITGGTIIRSIDEGSLMPCKEACFEDKDCKGFYYKHFGQKCYLYSGDIDFELDTTLSKSSYKIMRNYSSGFQ